MFITRLILNPFIPETQKLISNRQFLHGAVEACFYVKDESLLWRIVTDKRDPELYIVSEQKPDVKHIVLQYGREDERCTTIKDYGKVISSIQEGENYKLQIEVNPIARDTKTRRTIPIVNPLKIEDWSHHQSKSKGFEITGNILQQPKAISTIYKGKERINTNPVQIDCIVKVTNKRDFETFLKKGMGRTKAYGFGMPLIGKI